MGVCLNVLGIVLTLISVLCAAGPIVAVAIEYQSNPVELVAPPQVSNLVDDTLMNLTNFQMPQLVSTNYDAASRSAVLVVNFTNPVNMDFKLNEAYAEVRNHEDQTFLANANLVNPVSITGGQTVNITISCAWSSQAESYFLTQHAGAKTINVDLTQLTVNVNEITITLDQPIEIDNVPISV